MNAKEVKVRVRVKVAEVQPSEIERSLTTNDR